MALPVVVVASGGLPVVDVTATNYKLGLPVSTAVSGRGIPVTIIAAPLDLRTPGLPVTFVSP
jgi:hypothetical protein